MSAEFLALQLSHAHAIYRERGSINPVIAASMAALESAWGTSQLYVEARNPLGVKAGSSWGGPTVTLSTREERSDGTTETTQAAFRLYGSLQGAYEDFASIVETLSWYQDAEDAAQHPRDFLAGLIAKVSEVGEVLEPGWATDSTYFEKVWGIVTQHRVREAYARLLRVPMENFPSEPVGMPSRFPSRFRAVVFNPTFEPGDSEAFALAASGQRPLIIRAPSVASITRDERGAKLDVRRDAPGPAEVGGMNGSKGALQSTGVWGGLIAAVAASALLILPAAGLEVPPEVIAVLQALAGGGGLVAVSGRVTAKKPVKGLVGRN